ncbi:tetratricopeptide repeat protein [uncultured Kordia sp.]|uniref:tetratricopeptide repeat protein n=1 Tax=uncultured Kordia sp. TaxID=507699 RepID=UPI002639EB5D|nr:tetratricopeptide repeat protein [uncultured Kordia sp.]
MKKTLRFPLTFLFLFIFTISFAQLEASFKIPDSLKSKSYQELNAILLPLVFRQKKYKEAKIYADVLLTNALRENNELEKARAYNYLSQIYYNTGEYKKALAEITKSIAIAEENKYHGNILKLLYRRKGNSLFKLRDYDECLKFYLKELAVVKALKDKNAQLSIKYNIALIKLDLGDKKGSIKILKNNLNAYDSLTKVNKIDYLVQKIENLSALGTNYTDFNQLDSAMIVYREAYNLAKDTLPRKLSYVVAGIGNVYSLQKKNTEALEYLNNAQKIADSLQQKDLIPYIHLHKGRAYNGLEKHKEALFYLNKLDTLINDNDKGDEYDLQESYVLLANSYDALGDYKKAKENFQKFIRLDDDNDSKKSDLVNSIYERYDLKSLEKEIEHKEVTLSNTKIIIVLLSIVILLSILFFRHRARGNKRKFEALLKRLDDYKEEEKVVVPKIKTPKIDRKKLIPEEKAQELLQKLQKLEEQEIFLDQNCTIARLAKKMGTNASYASIIINDYRQKKFPEYLAELRINYATERLQEDSKFRSYTIKSIASDVGYKSPEAFSKSFKKINGIYPSYFIKKLNQKAQTLNIENSILKNTCS